MVVGPCPRLNQAVEKLVLTSTFGVPSHDLPHLLSILDCGWSTYLRRLSGGLWLLYLAVFHVLGVVL
jgi:hypothetical protein